MTRKKLLTVPEALAYQRDEYGRVIYGMDSLRAAIRNGTLAAVWVGTRRVFIPITALDRLLGADSRGEVA